MLKIPLSAERVRNFSDAIYAVAITLLVLEIRIPSAEEVAQLGIEGVLRARVPNFIGFLVSFFVTALFWRGHLLLFGVVTNMTVRLYWLNLLQLLFVVLMPFSTALYSFYVGSDVAFYFYCANLSGIGWMGYAITNYLIEHEPYFQEMPARELKWFRVRQLIPPIVFLGCIPLSMVNPWAGRLGFLLIFVFRSIGDRLYNKQAAVKPGQPT